MKTIIKTIAFCSGILYSQNIEAQSVMLKRSLLLYEYLKSKKLFNLIFGDGMGRPTEKYFIPIINI
jgi:hypothetical protein